MATIKRLPCVTYQNKIVSVEPDVMLTLGLCDGQTVTYDQLIDIFMEHNVLCVRLIKGKEHDGEY